MIEDYAERARMRVRMRVWGVLCALGWVSLGSVVAAAEGVSSVQRRAATDFLAAVAAGEPQPIAFALHPLELERLRTRVLPVLREEATRGESAVRTRLFGEAMPLTDIERLTSVDLFRAILRRLVWRGRAYAEIDGVAAVREGERVHLIVQGTTSKDRGSMRVVELVTVMPYGKEWKAAVPDEWRAQIEDLIAGRGAPAPMRSPAASPPSTPRASTERNPAPILALLDAAEKALLDNRCDRYYRDFLSPELRASLSGRTLDTLIKGCERSIAQRELLIAALRIVRRSSPAFEAGGDRAVYDVSGQGLPYDQYILARVEGRWYIAE